MNKPDKSIVSAEKIKDMIKAVLDERQMHIEKLKEKDIDQLAEEISIYHHELEYQNSELRRIQLDLERVNHHYIDLFEEAPLGYVIYGEDGLIVKANKLFSKHFFHTDGSKGKRIESLISPEDQDAFYLHLKKVISQRKKDTVYVQSSGPQRLFLRIESNLMPCEEEVLIRSAVIDITVERMYEEELKKAKEEAERANLAKSNFLRNISHDLRTPVGAIRGFAELIEMAESKDDIAESVEVITLSCDNMLKMVNNLIDLAKIESGKMDLAEEPFHLKDVTETTIKILSEKANSKGLELQVTISDDLPKTVIGDASHLQNILLNIVGNAIKFTQEGLIKIEVLPVTSDDNYGCIRFEITDTGIGFAKPEQSELFEPFTQFHKNQGDYEGSGLGLMISKKMIELMNGVIHLESEPGAGTSVIFTVCFKNR